MSEPKTLPAGGWVVLCDLQDNDDPTRIHSPEEVVNLVRDLGRFRALRREPHLEGEIRGQKGFGPSHPNLFRLIGKSTLDITQTMRMLAELGALLAEKLGQKQLEIHVGGNVVTITRGKIGPPTNVRLH